MYSFRHIFVLLTLFPISAVFGETENGNYNIKDASYAYAYEIAHQFLTPGGEGISINDFMLGLKDYVEGKPPKFSKENSANLVQYYYSQLSRVKSHQLRAQSEPANNELQYVARQPGVVTSHQGLKYRIIREGRGQLPADDDVILFEYRLGSPLAEGKGQTSRYAAKTCTYKCDSIQDSWMTFLKRMREGSEYVIYVPKELELDGKSSIAETDPSQVTVYTVKILAIKPYEKIE